MERDLEHRFLAEVKRLWTPATPLVVGLSGGIDSMALLVLLTGLTNDWGSALHLVHVDHRLRQNSSQEAAWLKEYVLTQFSRELAVATVSVTQNSGESLEMAARRVRYEVLLGFAEKWGSSARVVVGHQKSDQAETVLMRILMGTGVRGLVGIPQQNGRIVRPLLNFTRQELKQHLVHRNVHWLDDASNADPAMLRNRLRLEIIPRLESINPRLQEALAGLADRALDYEQAFTFMADRWLGDRGINPFGEELPLPPEWRDWPKELTALVLRRFADTHQIRLTSRHIRLTFEGTTSWPQGYKAEHQADGGLRVAVGQPNEDAPQAMPLPLSGVAPWGPHILEVQSQIFDGRARPGWTAIDINRWSDLHIRSWNFGDRVRPLGLGGHSKKIQDLFVDAKIPRTARATWPLVVSREFPELVLAVPGVVASEDGRADVGDRVVWVRMRDPGRDTLG